MKKEKTPKLLNDKIANIIFTCEECRSFVELVIAKALDIDVELIKDNLTLQSGRINESVETKYSTADSIYEFDKNKVNIEVNISDGESTQAKNFRYICNMVLSQVRVGESNAFIK